MLQNFQCHEHAKQYNVSNVPYSNPQKTVQAYTDCIRTLLILCFAVFEGFWNVNAFPSYTQKHKNLDKDPPYHKDGVLDKSLMQWLCDNE